MAEVKIENLREALKPRQVFYFQADEPGFDEPHYMVCVAVNENDIYSFLSCTSNIAQREVRARKFGHQSIIDIPHSDPTNPLNRETYITANRIGAKHTFGELEAKFKAEPQLLNKCWVLGLGKFHEIISALHSSEFLTDSEKANLPSLEEIIDGKFDY